MGLPCRGGYNGRVQDLTSPENVTALRKTMKIQLSGVVLRSLIAICRSRSRRFPVKKVFPKIPDACTPVRATSLALCDCGKSLPTHGWSLKVTKHQGYHLCLVHHMHACFIYNISHENHRKWTEKAQFFFAERFPAPRQGAPALDP